MNATLEEDSEIANLIPGMIVNVRINSLKINEKLFFYEKRKIDIPATGESDYEHLILLKRPERRTFAHTLDARNLKFDGSCIVEKSPFKKTDFGRTYYFEEYTADARVLELTRIAFRQVKR